VIAATSHNWSFVIAGYSITTVTLVGYWAWIRRRTRRIRRSLPDDDQ